MLELKTLQELQMLSLQSLLIIGPMNEDRFLASIAEAKKNRIATANKSTEKFISKETWLPSL